jgi:hypothetical protein
MLVRIAMEPLTAAARPPSPLLGLLGLVPIMAAILTVLVVPLVMFETGRELARRLTMNQVALVIMLAGLVLNVARPCRCGWRRR